MDRQVVRKRALRREKLCLSCLANEGQTRINANVSDTVHAAFGHFAIQTSPLTSDLIFKVPRRARVSSLPPLHNGGIPAVNG